MNELSSRSNSAVSAARASPAAQGSAAPLGKVRGARRLSPRPIVQAAVIAALIALPTGLFHLACPFGGVETLTRVFAQGLYVPKTGLANLILLGAVLLSSLIAGPVFCGWICPLGAAQDWVRSLGRRLGIRALNAPKKLERVLSLGRYLVLGLIVWATAQSFNLVFMKADPYYALLHFWTGEAAPLALAAMAVVLVASLFVARPWCRWFCPLGALLSLVGNFSFITIKRPASCAGCRFCAKACPVGLDLSKNEATSDPRCIRCGDCAAACPPMAAIGKRKPRAAQIAVTAALLVAFALVPGLIGKGQSGAHRAAAPTAATSVASNR